MKKDGVLGSADLVGVIKEVAPTGKVQTDAELGVEEFQTKYFPHPVYVDEARSMYQYLGSRSITKDVPFSWNPFKLWASFKGLGERLKAKGIEGNYNGEGLVLGGVVVYSKDKGVVYEYKESTGSEVPREDIVAAIKSCQSSCPNQA